MVISSKNKKYKGLIHCHTNMSYDCSIDLPELCQVLKDKGFDFVAITDHNEGLTEHQYREFVSKCQEISSSNFIVLPGLELLLDDGNEVAAIGVENLIYPTSMQEVVDIIRDQNGYSVWVHPHKRGRANLNKCVCDSMEIMNCKVDGNLSVNLKHFFKAVISRNIYIYPYHLIVGQDIHDLKDIGAVSVICDLDELTKDSILVSLKSGAFYNEVSRAKICADGSLNLFSACYLIFFRLAYLIWNCLLDNSPRVLRNWLVTISRKKISQLKSDV